MIGAIKQWLAMRAFGKALDELQRHDLAALKEDLELAVQLIGHAEDQERDGLPCSASNFAMEAIHTVKCAIGQRVRPAPYEHYARNVPLRQWMFGYRAPSSPERAGKRPAVRMLASTPVPATEKGATDGD